MSVLFSFLKLCLAIVSTREGYDNFSLQWTFHLQTLNALMLKESFKYLGRIRFCIKRMQSDLLENKVNKAKCRRLPLL